MDMEGRDINVRLAQAQVLRAGVKPERRLVGKKTAAHHGELQSRQPGQPALLLLPEQHREGERALGEPEAAHYLGVSVLLGRVPSLHCVPDRPVDSLHALVDGGAVAAKPAVVRLLTGEHGQNTRPGTTFQRAIDEDKLELLPQQVADPGQLDVEYGTFRAGAVEAQESLGRCSACPGLRISLGSQILT